MPLKIKGVEYYPVAEVAESLGISRVTLWRWRHDGKIPRGLRLRGRQVIFTRAHLDAIREFALRVEPIDPDSPDQLALFRPPNPARIRP